MILPTAIVGMIVHARRHRVSWDLAFPISAGSVVGAIIGAWVALQVEADVLRRMFAVLLVILAIRMVWGTTKGEPPSPNEATTGPASRI